MKITILPNTLERGIHPHAASSRIRGLWVAKYLVRRGFNVSLATTMTSLDSDVIIFQKFYEAPAVKELMIRLQKANKVVILDLCDADWLQPQKKARLLEIMPFVSYGVGASPLITSWLLANGCISVCIPDGVDLDEADSFKMHKDVNPITLAWFGNSSNFSLIEGKEKEAEARGCKLVTISDHPKAVKRWRLDTINQELMACDIFWDPRGSGVYFEGKTNNKELKAWSLGLPVIHEERLGPQFDKFLTAKARKDEADFRLDLVKTYYSMGVVIGYWVSLLNLVGKRYG